MASTSIVPMPSWSTPIGIAKLLLSTTTLSLISACIHNLGGIPSFAVTLLASILSLLGFGYFITSLSLRRSLYNKWAVLTLELFQTVLWMIATVMLAGWISDNRLSSTHFSSSTTTYIPIYIPPMPTGSQRRDTDFSRYVSDIWTFPFDRFQTGAEAVVNMISRAEPASYDDPNQRSTLILAGVTGGISAILFVLYALTLTFFAANFSKTKTMTSDDGLTCRRGSVDEENFSPTNRAHAQHSMTQRS
ncbi:hypothetical protein LTR66_016275, partial [Elasticomyces elasticus]